jgi:ribosomal protein S18 acetylase RimI-like enzyme
MPPDIRIRPSTTQDIEPMVSMVEQYWRFETLGGFDRPTIGALLRRVMQDPRLGQAWIATVDGAPAGYLLAVYVFSLEFKGLTAEIDELFVAPEYRNLGLGGSLLSAAEGEFRALGCTNVFLQLGRRNDAARRFYRRYGFAERAGFELIDKMLTGESA